MSDRPSLFHLLNLRSASGVALALLVGQALAFLREAVLVYVFGASAETDAFFVAMTIPDVVLQLTLAGATTAAMIPLLSGSDGSSDAEHQRRVVGTLLWLYLVLGGGIIVAGWFAMPLVVRGLAPGFAPDTRAIAVTLGRYVLPVPLFLSLAGICTGLLNYHGRFMLPALRFSVQSLTVAVATLLLGARYGIPVAAIAASVGALLSLLGLLPDVHDLLRGGRVSLRPDRLVLAGYLRLALPIVGTAVLVQLVLVGEKIAASHFPPGSVASIVLARKIVFFGIAVGMQSFVTVIYPRLARAAGGRNWREFRQSLRAAMLTIGPLMTLGAVVLWLLADPLVALLLGRGQFDPADAARVALLVRWLGLTLPVSSLCALLVQSFNARKDALVPFGVGLLATAGYLGLLFALPNAYGLVGIPIALVASDAARMLILARIAAIRTPSSRVAT